MTFLLRSSQYAFILFSGVLVLILIANAIVLLYARPYIVSDMEDLSPAQAVIILGAGVSKDGTLSPVLKERVDTAVVVYKKGLVEKILMSGDNSSKNYNEVSPVHQYLLDSGVPVEDIFLDYAGFDSYDTMYRAKSIFGVESAVIVTQTFHLSRSLFIANNLGIKAEGIHPPADKSTWHNYLREMLSVVKAVYDVSFKSDPTYLGEEIPITGDGRESVGE